MQYAQAQRQPGKHSIGFGVVVLLHVVVVYALVTGLAKKVVDVIKQPLETKIIEAPKPPPEAPPPPPPPPKLAPPPPDVFVPMPEVQIQVPVTQSPPAITAVTTKPPEAQPPAVVAAPPAKPVPVAVGVACPNSQKVRAEVAYPREAQRQELEGDTLVEFTVDREGRVSDAQVVKSSHRVFDAVSLATVRLFKCVGQGQDVKVQVPFVFKLDR
ncbi:energy transducer TonB [Piscinibacter terrae]|uniref:Protein TonB n=1 Tax=Piscinibacter terrae TaxID=2496871 RepID=A0A3N7HTB7_9BURK|nr:energy transducer TonB [Albitalea terrae]RQP25558.1 energy transducer TonB [Albitalea terrae]